MDTIPALGDGPRKVSGSRAAGAGSGTVPAARPALLAVDSVDFSYGSLQVLFDVHLDVPEGGRVALLGTNGAGKSTLLRVVAGLLTPASGAIRFRGEDVTALPPDQRVRRGMTLVEGGRAVFPSVSVRDNLGMGAYHLPKGDPEIERRLEEALQLFPALRARLGQPAGTLSGGEQQMVAFGRALVAAPDLLLVDELSLGLAPVVMQEIAGAVDRVVSRGTTLLIVEQSLNVALALADQAYFMEKGEVRFSGSTAELLERGDLVRSVFFGTAGGGL
ncbi:MAG TPA: ABC transporter ATP-binding protein [Acidimicrobiales bacterium]|nr:ABC transporter ATP-binding protein [Acidimicrobiales bacterium]